MARRKPIPPAPGTRPRSARLTDAERAHVAQYITDNPDLSDRVVALHMGVTAPQVRHAREQAARGEIRVRQNGLKGAPKARTIMQQRSVNELLQEQLHFGMAQLAEAEKIPAGDRINLCGAAARTQRVMLATRLEGHLKTTDAGTILELVRIFVPDATEDQVIRYYHEARERCRVNEA